MEIKTLKPHNDKPIISKPAVLLWAKIIEALFYENEDDNLRQIIIPVNMYRAGQQSDDGVRKFMPPIAIDRNDDVLAAILDALYEITCDEDWNDCNIALNRRVLCVMYAAPPYTNTLDIIDVTPNYEGDIKLFTKYTALKTGNGFHLYAKENVTDCMTNGGIIVMDPKWKTGFIRVTESDGKGTITEI